MKYLQDKIVLITGAGFSASANLPIQDKILDEMAEAPIRDFMSKETIGESRKFLSAYIRVAIYLLKEYGNFQTEKFEKKFEDLVYAYETDKRVSEVLVYIQDKYGDKLEEKDFNISEILEDVAETYIVGQNKYDIQLVGFKEELREQLENKKIKISLEDIFTVFDKSIEMHENTKNYTYTQMDALQHSVLRLFTYYFSKKTNEHTYLCQDYEEVIKYLEEHTCTTSIITTNWDVLFEKYMLKNGIKYDYKFNSKYVLGNSVDEEDVDTLLSASINLLKIHGSINWFRCLRCGTLQVYSADECGLYLFDDSKLEMCNKCGQVANGAHVQIKPEIITPTMLKSINSQLYSNLWQNAAYELQKADKIIFCGYSLPIADFEFRYLLKQNIRAEAKIDVVLYHNDDPANMGSNNAIKGLLPERRFKDLFSNNEYSFFYDGFGEYFRRLNEK